MKKLLFMLIVAFLPVCGGFVVHGAINSNGGGYDFRVLQQLEEETISAAIKEKRIRNSDETRRKKSADDYLLDELTWQQANLSAMAVSIYQPTVAAGGVHSLALDDKGRVWAWGKASIGELGIGPVGSSMVRIPTQVTAVPGSPLNGKKIKNISAGGTHSLAVDRDGNTWVWGNNIAGQLGLGLDFLQIPQFLPVQLTGLNLTTP